MRGGMQRVGKDVRREAEWQAIRTLDHLIGIAFLTLRSRSGDCDFRHAAIIGFMRTYAK